MRENGSDKMIAKIATFIGIYWENMSSINARNGF